VPLYGQFQVGLHYYQLTFHWDKGW